MALLVTHAGAFALTAVAVPQTVPKSPPAAQADGVSAEQPAAELLAVRINEVEQAEPVVALRMSARSLAVPVEAFALWRLRRPDTRVLRIEGRDHIPLEAIAGLRWRIDSASQTLVITVPSAAFLRNEFEVVGESRPAQTIAGLGGYLNYDLNWQREAATGASPATQSGGGLIELGAFDPSGNGRSSGVWRSAGGSTRFTRLDTQWNVDLPASTSSVRVGDAIGVAGSWGRSVRFGGVQWATDFAVQPGLVSFPMPAIRGEASVPSIVDLYVNNAHQLQGKLPPGPFDLPDVPVVTGQGQIRMVVRDLLGREQVVVQPYYVSPALLREGLHDFALEAGTVRLDYGLDSLHYGQAFATATDRVGVSDTFTRELRAELLRNQQTIGASGTWLVKQFATATASAAASRSDTGLGVLVSGGVDHQAADWSAGVQGRTASRGFVQLGQSATLGQAPRSTLTANVATSIGHGGAGLNYVQQTTWEGERFRSLSVNYGRSLGVLGYLSVFASRTVGSSTGTTVGVNLIQVLGRDTSASVSSFRNRDRNPDAGTHDDNQTVLQLQGSAPVGPGWGYQLQAARGNDDRFNADATWNTESASFTGGLARTGGSGVSSRAGASGGLAWMPEGVFASRRIDGSFAVVKVGDYPGVRVTRDNQFVARTDANGNAFVAGLRGFETNRLGVEAADLPLDAQVDQLHVAVAPGRGSGVSVHFPVLRTRAATLRLVTADGSPVPPGSRVRIEGDAREFPVGFDGRLFLAGLGDRTTIRADWGSLQCTASVVLHDADEPVPELGVVECR